MLPGGGAMLELGRRGAKVVDNRTEQHEAGEQAGSDREDVVPGAARGEMLEGCLHDLRLRGQMWEERRVRPC